MTAPIARPREGAAVGITGDSSRGQSPRSLEAPPVDARPRIHAQLEGRDRLGGIVSLSSISEAPKKTLAVGYGPNRLLRHVGVSR
jgi:hypothetical protein